MRQSSKLIIVAVALAILAGCNHMSYATLPGDLVSEEAVAYREVGNFEIEVGESYWLWGLAKSSDEAVARAILEKVREMGGNGVRDLKYKVGFTFLDLCISCFGSIITYQTQTVTVTGAVVQITGAKASADIVTVDQLEEMAQGSRQMEIPLGYD